MVRVCLKHTLNPTQTISVNSLHQALEHGRAISTMGETKDIRPFSSAKQEVKAIIRIPLPNKGLPRPRVGLDTEADIYSLKGSEKRLRVGYSVLTNKDV